MFPECLHQLQIFHVGIIIERTYLHGVRSLDEFVSAVACLPRQLFVSSYAHKECIKSLRPCKLRLFITERTNQ